MKIELAKHRQLVHEMDLPIRWGDMDALGHVNNAVYFQYMESGRIAWFESLGCAFRGEGQGIVIVNAFCNFIQQLEYPGDVCVQTWASDLGRSSLNVWTTMQRSDAPGTLCAAGGATVVWVDFAAQKSAPFPPALRSKLENATAQKQLV